MKRFRLIPAEAIGGELRLPVQITSVYMQFGQPRYQKKPRPCNPIAPQNASEARFRAQIQRPLLTTPQTLVIVKRFPEARRAHASSCVSSGARRESHRMQAESWVWASSAVPL